jgi:hypothetical protein
LNSFSTTLKRHRGILSGAALVLTVAAIFWVVNSPAVVGASAADRVLPIYSVKRDDKTVAISFDAAWGNVIVRRRQAATRSRKKNTILL